MSAPLLFARDDRLLPYFPVTLDALAAIAEHVPAKRLAYARSLYLAILEAANKERDSRAAISRKSLGTLTGCSPDLISDLAPLLEKAGVLQVISRVHDGQRLENEWVAITPPTERGVVAPSHEGRGSQPQQSLRREEGNSKGGVTPLTPELDAEDPVETVWQTYDSNVLKPNRMRRRLDPTARRIIQAALKVRPLDEVLAAIIGLSKSPHHNGKNDRKKKYLDLRYALRGNAQSGQTIEERIDMMSEMAGDTPNAERFKKRTDGSELL